MQLSLAIRRLKRLPSDRSGVALIEFAYGMPILFGIGMYGIEVSNFAQANLRVSQIALSVADNASRVGVMSNLNVQQLREVDINDVFQAVRLQSPELKLPANGRITMSSLEQNAQGGQWIHWQRCLGLKKGAGYDSSYGKEGDGKNGNSVTGMGPVGAQVTAPDQISAVIFVEVNYDYQPVIGSWLMGPKKIQYTASFIVRDKRNLDHNSPSDAAASGGQPAGGVYNPAPQATAMTCDKWTS